VRTLGAHYTYADVPYDRWWASLTWVTFNEWVGWERNNLEERGAVGRKSARRGKKPQRGRSPSRRR